MKKGRTLLIIMICLIGILIGGCGKEKKKEEKKPLTIYEQLTIKDTPLSDDDSNVIENGINNWVKGFLAVNSTEEDKELADKILYQSVTNEAQKEALKSDRDAFYSSGVIVVDEATTVLTDTKQAEYEKENVGVVSCETTIRGTVSGTAFEKKYTMQMVVKRDENETVTVYEINDIAWE
ncbi:hypothetical protein KFE17_10000 [Faecalicatena sp. Marseille-Q4148]|nr:hypothetical protein KFE17_10000 [Faecalicatena sp. Marseille-Q4148]